MRNSDEECRISGGGDGYCFVDVGCGLVCDGFGYDGDEYGDCDGC